MTKKEDLIELKEEIVKIGDTINLNLKFTDEEVTEKLKLVEQHPQENEVSLSSSLGALIHEKPIGFSGEYSSASGTVKVKIISKC